MSDQILEDVDNIACSFDKPSDNMIFMKQSLTKTNSITPEIDFDNFHIAMSKNGGMVAFVKKTSYFIMDSKSVMKTHVRLFYQDLNNEIQIKFEEDNNKPIILFDFTDDEKLYAILNNGTIWKFDLSTKRIVEKTTGPTFQLDNIVIAHYFQKGFVSLTNGGNFYIVNSMKELSPILFCNLGQFIQTSPIVDFIVIPQKKSGSGRLEVLFPNPQGIGLVKIIEQENSKFNMDKKTGTLSGIFYIEKDKSEPFVIGKSGVKVENKNNLGAIVSMAMSPSKNQIALYNKDINVVYFFHSSLDANLDKYPRMSAMYQINEKDLQRNREEQKEILKGYPGQFVFCGEDAVCLSGKRFVFIINVKNKTIVYKISNKIPSSLTCRLCYCLSEVDGLRVLTNTEVFFISKVSRELYDVCLSEDDPSHKLLKAYAYSEDKDHNCDRELRDISDDLPSAINTLQKAAAQLWDQKTQLGLLKAAQYGKNFVKREDYNFDNFIQKCQSIRIVNNLRKENPKRLITFTEFDKLDPKVLIDKLLKAKQFYVAFEIANYLKINTKKVFEKYIISMIKSLRDDVSRPEEEMCYETIKKVLKKASDVSYLKLAKTAIKYKKEHLGLLLLENEKSLIIKIPQYIELKEWDKAIEYALQTYDSVVLLTVFDKILKHETVSDFIQIVNKYKGTESIVKQYFMKYRPEELDTYLKEKKNFEELFFLSLENFFRSKDLKERAKYVENAREYLKQLSNNKERDPNFDCKFYEGYLNDLENSIAFKKELLESNIINKNDIRPFDCSLYQSMKDTVQFNQENFLIKTNKGVFKLSDKKIAITKIQAYAESKNFKPLITLSNDLKKSNLTYLNLAEVFMDMDDKNRAADAIQKITDKDYFEYKIELLKYLDRLPEALEAIISNKDCDNQLYLVRDILKRDSDGSLKRKVDELIAKYGELTGE